MKKKLISLSLYVSGLFLTGLLALSGCSQDEVSDSGPDSARARAISFRAQGGTGGLKATTTGGDKIHSFVVNAVRDDGAWGTDPKYLMKGTTVYRNEGGTGWTYAPEVYYPTVAANNFVEFFAYSPSGSQLVSPGLGSAADQADKQIIGYTVPKPAGSGATSQEDLLVAYSKVLKAGYDNPVKLQFRHALSRILVSAKSGLSGPVTITGLELVNVYSTGDLNLKPNTSTGTAPSNGIPVSETSSGEQTAWSYNPTPVNATDYVTLWTNPDNPTNYPYVLPASGVSVGATSTLVTSLEQGMFVLPQTTIGDPSDANTAGEFGLVVTFKPSGGMEQTALVQFGDYNVLPNMGVTFEIGRQYVLNLDFQSTGGNVKIGASITFDNIDSDIYGLNLEFAAQTPWAKSNVYFKPDSPGGYEGVLTFAETINSQEVDKLAYQGLFFKYGSLVGIAGGPGGAAGVYDGDTYLYIPDINTGKYYKVKSSQIDVSYASGSSAMNAAVHSFATVTTYSSYASIPEVLAADLTSQSGDLTLASSPSFNASFKGDLCKFLSETAASSGNGLTTQWQIASPAEWDSFINVGNASTYLPYSDHDGTSAEGFNRYYSANGYFNVPTSGQREAVSGNLNEGLVLYFTNILKPAPDYNKTFFFLTMISEGPYTYDVTGTANPIRCLRKTYP